MREAAAVLSARRTTAPMTGSQTPRLHFAVSVMETLQPRADYSGVLMRGSLCHFLRFGT